MSNRTIYFAIPALNEKDFLPLTLDCIGKQQCEAMIKVYICINQPESWWDTERIKICENNQQTIELLKNYPNLDIHLIDKSSKGNGWGEKKQGVGCARKLLTDTILTVASDDDLLINMDADTTFDADYCQTVLDNFNAHKTAVALAVPYYHRLPLVDVEDRAILHYEIYMRSYNLNLLRIGSPYAFTALGSAIVCTIKACRAVEGFDTDTAGEDFYFLQKLAKYGPILRYNTSRVYPSSRFSSRVPFGTGPAIRKGSQGNWKSYPIFDYRSFDYIEQIYKQIPILFYRDIDNKFTDFLKSFFATDDIWEPLRTNYKSLSTFTRAFHHRIDGLRIFQFLRHHRSNIKKSDDKCLTEFFEQYYPEEKPTYFEKGEPFYFDSATLFQLKRIRNFFIKQETRYQQAADAGVK